MAGLSHRNIPGQNEPRQNRTRGKLERVTLDLVMTMSPPVYLLLHKRLLCWGLPPNALTAVDWTKYLLRDTLITRSYARLKHKCQIVRSTNFTLIDE